MKAKYLGRFYLDYTTGYTTEPIFVPDGKEPIDNEFICNYYEANEFMRTQEGTFDAVATQSNTSAVAMKAIDNSVELVKLWRIS